MTLQPSRNIANKIDIIKQQRSVHYRLDGQGLTGYALDNNNRCANHRCSVRQRIE